jgi:hypothetical protein
VEAGVKLDPAAIVTAMLGATLSPVLAEVAGPYATVVGAATVGASWALHRCKPRTRAGAALFVLRLVMTAVMVTAGVVALTERFTGGQDSTWMFAPVAFLIGGVGDDWPAVVSWLALRVAGFFGYRSGGPP